MAPKVYRWKKDGLDLALEVEQAVKRYYTDILKTVMWKRWVRSYKTVYGLAGMEDPFDISKAMSTGEEGELTSIKVNHSGSMLKRAVALVSQTVPDFEAVPTNTDSKSLEQVDFTKNLLAYCIDTKGVGAGLFDTAFSSGIFGISWFNVEWDPRAGRELKPEERQGIPDAQQKTGDLTFRMFDPLDVVVNRVRYDQEHDWQITRRWVNRYDLAARYPALEEKIVGLHVASFKDQAVATNSIEAERAMTTTEDGDELVPLFTLYHRKTDALPQGKYAQVLSGDILLTEGPLPYADVPLIPICPGKFLRTSNGDAPLHHVLGLQDIYDNLASAVATNNVAFATQIVMVPDEADYSYKEVARGLSVLRYTMGPDGKNKPEGLNLTAPQQAALEFMNLLRTEMETIFGVSATLRGNPQPNIQSGAFGALVAQQALEYAGAFQYSFQQAVAKTGNTIVQILKQYAKSSLAIEIAGRSKAYEVRSFNSDDLSNIDRVVVRSGNPAARTAQFALAAADSLLAKGAINAQQYLLLQRTGSLESGVDQGEAREMNLRRENELIAQGQKPVMNILDRHKSHIVSHGDELSSPAARENARAQQAGLAHIAEHINALRTVDPALLALIGETPLGPAPGAPVGPQGTPPAPNAPPGPGSMPGDQARPDPLPPPPPGGPLPDQPTLPNQPTNPLTGAPASPLDGSIQG
jgi:hypothetical protein